MITRGSAPFTERHKMTFTKAELEILVESLEWAVRGYRIASINSPEAKNDLVARRDTALGLIVEFNKMREE